MAPIAEASSSLIDPPAAPQTLAASGLSSELVTDLVLKTLHRASDLSGAEVARRLGLGFPIIEPSLDFLKLQRQCEITGGSTMGGSAFRYRLTEAGHSHALNSLDRNRYVGIAPVPVSQYCEYMRAFGQAPAPRVTADDVRAAFTHLVVTDRVVDEIGPAVNGCQSIFLYGPPGNGKTIMARSIRSLLAGTIAIPHALELAGSIIRFFDAGVHEPVAQPEPDEATGYRSDRRWIVCRRPMVIVGGELTLESLALAYNPRSGVYNAPVQAMANGGVLLIDDFGRQRCSPRDLLNWWMIPLESRVESLSLLSGEKFEMPFLALVIFSTNLRPSELVDEAFLRRIQYKILAENPTPEGFIEIFDRYCVERGIPFERDLVVEMMETFFRQRGIELRACQPRDLIDRALALASYRGAPRRLTSELLTSACVSYFIDRREARREAPRSEASRAQAPRSETPRSSK